ncbi:ATP-binding protein [uncultured Brevundimonas sp.]|uniref:PAS domain-containing sensor histidine kinase n=1 Tax=uncultured Brevundimonas sp. TaxID=213418 RepID=UPI002634FC7D|nr:ATP-binding protein [uncultured Brevundimonas sp.]
MRGTERRKDSRGRRSTDHPGLWGRPHERALFLTALMILAMALLLVARDRSRPEREIEASNRQALALEARLYAEQVGYKLNQLERVLDRADAELSGAGDKTLSALEAAAKEAPDAVLVLASPSGNPLAVHAGGASTTNGITLAEGKINLARPRANRQIIAAALPAPELVPSDPSVRLDLRQARQLPDTLFDHDRHVVLPDPQGQSRVTLAVRVGDSPLAVVADRPARALWVRWRDDARLMLIPLALGLALMIYLALRTFRQDRATREWADTERRFRIAVEAARCGVWEWDLEAGRIILSDYMAKMLDLAAGTVLTTEAMIDRVHPLFRDEFAGAIARARTTGQFEAAFPVPSPDGDVIWLDARGRSRSLPINGEALHFMGIAIDITEARRAKARAQAAEDRLIDGIQSVSDAFVLFDRQGLLVMWNQAFADTFHFPPTALYRGAHKSELNRIAAKAIRSEHRAEARRAGVREVELLDGRWLQLTERYTGDGGTVVIGADVTLIRQQESERRKAAEELQRTVDELEASRSRLTTLAQQYEAAMIRAEAASQSKSEFLANMSHELRTPLNAINGFSEIMAKEMFGPLGDSRYRGYASDIHNSGKHLLSLINDILDMAKIEAGKLHLYYERIDLGALGRDVLRLMRGRAEEAGQVLTLETPDLLEAEVDLRGMKQVLLNLVSNAIKFTPRNGRVTVEMKPLTDRPGHIRIAVSDTGIGISQEDIARLAQPFVQVENQHAKTTQGTGLGLALTKSLIEMHGGQMVIDSEIGTGTTVWFDLPARPQQVQGQKAQPAIRHDEMQTRPVRSHQTA